MHFKAWEPLDPDKIFYGFDLLAEWKEILGGTKGAALFKHFDKDSSWFSFDPGEL